MKNKLIKNFAIQRFIPYLAYNSTCHASPRCTLWQVFAFYRVNLNCINS